MLSTGSFMLLQLPSPLGLSFWWNLGSLLSFCLLLQLSTGVFLAMHYSSQMDSAFESVVYISREVNLGWAIRMSHANGASAFFICIYLHIGRSLYFSGFLLHSTWMVGITILFLLMASAFLGYVLPWGQMSFWGASVITNLFSAIPVIGPDFVIWLWGGLSVNRPTLSRFFALHFLLPFLVSALVMIHILFLHETGSSNPLGVNSNLEKISLYPLFLLKDFLGLMVFLGFFLTTLSFFPWNLGDPENFNPANPFTTPPHIQPEWYFLFAYAILRAIPNKLGGVIALVMAMGVLYLVPLFMPSYPLSGKFSNPLKILLWSTVSVITLLTWVGARPVESPYVGMSQALTVSYFSVYLLMAQWKSAQCRLSYPIFSA